MISSDDWKSKYFEILDEKRKLREEIRLLKTRLGIIEYPVSLIQPALDLLDKPATQSVSAPTPASEFALMVETDALCASWAYLPARLERANI